MGEQLYFDDSEDGEGPSRATSHPEYVRACEEELFYDCLNDPSPFGNDDGADTLFKLEDWYRGGAKGTIRTFLDFVLRQWGGPIPDLEVTDRATVTAWLDDPKLGPALVFANRVVLAVTFGQLKISGEFDDAMLRLADAALDRQQIDLEHRLQSDPTWAPAAEVRSAIDAMRGALEKMKKRRRN